jgi:hypothetical protein
MKNEFIPYEEALALKELGFDEKCYGYYTEHKEYFYFDVDDLSSTYTKNMDNLIVNSVDDLECTAPLYQQAFSWFREKYNLDSYILPLEDRHNPGIIGYQYKIHIPYIHKGLWGTYEEAELACLRKLIELLKPKENE